MSVHRDLGGKRGVGDRLTGVGWIIITLALIAVNAAWSQSVVESVERGGHPIETAPLDVGRATAASTKIARGTLGDSATAWVGRKIYTFYDLIISETIKGESQSKITVAVPGGSKGKIASTWVGAPQFATGDEIVFFGKQFGQGPAFVAYGLFSGLVQVRTNPASGRSLVGASGQPVDLEDFLNDIRSRQ